MKKAEKEHLSKVAGLGCIICREHKGVFSPAEIHHIREGQGMGQRASNYETIGLCPYHHRTGPHGECLHAGIKSFESNFGLETELLEKVMRLINE